MTADQDSGSVLPVRTTRTRRRGRHSSPHQLSLPSDSPALVIAVPGSARPDSDEIAGRVADMAAASCHGAEIRIGYLRGGQDHLIDVLADLGGRDGLAGVVVPLLPFPNPEVDRAIADAVATADAPFVVADHLGPHPLLAEALHNRLADVGLARASRVGRISIVTEQAADGVIVGAVGGEEAVQAAEVVAVLLASRLTTPVAAASLTDPGSIKDAAAQLHRAVPRVALAPCMVGPELTSGTLEAIAALTSTDCAPPLGSHPAIGQLVAIRYGAALADPKVASMEAEAQGKAASPTSAARNGTAPAAPSSSGAAAPGPGQSAAGGDVLRPAGTRAAGPESAPPADSPAPPAPAPAEGGGVFRPARRPAGTRAADPEATAPADSPTAPAPHPAGGSDVFRPARPAADTRAADPEATAPIDRLAPSAPPPAEDGDRFRLAPPTTGHRDAASEAGPAAGHRGGNAGMRFG